MKGVTADWIVPEKHGTIPTLVFPDMDVKLYDLVHSGNRMFRIHHPKIGELTFTEVFDEWKASITTSGGLDDVMPFYDGSDPEWEKMWKCNGDIDCGGEDESIAVAIEKSSRIFGNHSHEGTDEVVCVIDGNGKIVFGEPGSFHTMGFRGGSCIKIPGGIGHAIHLLRGIVVILQSRRKISDDCTPCRLV